MAWVHRDKGDMLGVDSCKDGWVVAYIEDKKLYCRKI